MFKYHFAGHDRLKLVNVLQNICLIESSLALPNGKVAPCVEQAARSSHIALCLEAHSFP